MKTTHASRDSERNLALALLAVSFISAALLPVNTAFTVLKETPIFWRNIGGYPVDLRELVLATYFPVLAVNFVLCCAATAFFRRKCVLSGGFSVNSLTMLLLFWSIWFLNVGLLLANNIRNFMQGSAFHFHAAYDWLP